METKLKLFIVAVLIFANLSGVAKTITSGSDVIEYQGEQWCANYMFFAERVSGGDYQLSSVLLVKKDLPYRVRLSGIPGGKLCAIKGENFQIAVPHGLILVWDDSRERLILSDSFPDKETIESDEGWTDYLRVCLGAALLEGADFWGVSVDFGMGHLGPGALTVGHVFLFSSAHGHGGESDLINVPVAENLYLRSAMGLDGREYYGNIRVGAAGVEDIQRVEDFINKNL